MSLTRINKTGAPRVAPASDGRLTISVQRTFVTLPDGGLGASRPWDREPTPLQLALARGHRWLALLESGKVFAAACQERAAGQQRTSRPVHRGGDFRLDAAAGLDAVRLGGKTAGAVGRPAKKR